MILLVTMMTSSAVFASSLMIRYTICRKEASLFWNSLEMPKKRVVASFVGNFSPVNSRRAILVRSMRHLRGDIGELLNTRAIKKGKHSSGSLHGGSTTHLPGRLRCDPP